MRFSWVFLLTAMVSVSAGAQPVPPTIPGAPFANTPALAEDGKIKLGLEGRGNYRKPKTPKANAAEAALARVPPPNSKPPATRPSDLEAPTQPVAEVKPRGLRDDKSLFANRQAKAAPPPSPAPTPAPAPAFPNALPALQPNGGLYSENMR